MARKVRSNDPRHLARYNHKDYVEWTEPDGTQAFGLKNYANIKRAMLATGTQKKFRMYSGTTGFIVSWSMASVWLRWHKAIEPGGRLYGQEQ
jgi:hypothetical protein